MEKHLLISLLLNKKVFTFEEALGFMPQMEISIFDKILLREDFDSGMFFEKITNDQVHFLLAKKNEAFMTRVSELSITELLGYIPKFSSFLGIEIIEGRSSEMTTKNYIYFFKAVTKGGTMFLSDLNVAEKFISKIENPHMIFEIIKAVPNKIIRRYLSESNVFVYFLMNKANVETQLEIAKIADCENVWKQLFASEKFLEHFLCLEPEEALKIARNSEEEIVENAVFNGISIPREHMLNYAYVTCRRTAWKKIFYSDMFCASSAVELGCLPERVKMGIDHVILEREDVINYLNELDSEHALDIMKNYESGLIAKFLLERKDLIFETGDLLTVMQKYKNFVDIWSIGLSRNEVISYFKTFKDDELVAYAREHDSALLWKFVVKNLPAAKALSFVTENMKPFLAEIVLERLDETFNPKSFLFLAKVIDRVEVWGKVLSMPKIKEYVNQV